ncbi:hypothetical protein Tco_0404706 [Tanacetum coccineum]
MVWVEINGLSLCVWEFNAFKKVVSLFGKFKFFDTEVEDCMRIGRVCIATKKHSFIYETVNVVIHGETFEVHVKEIGTRSIHITGDLVSNDLGDRCDVEECRSLNDEVDPNDILDDFIQHVLEEKELSNVPKDVQHVEKRVNDEHVARRNKMENKDVDSDATIPPGFENLFNVYKHVGGALGYDVKGCKRSLRRMINGIDFPWDRLFLLSDRLRQETHLSILLNGDTWSYGNLG